MAKITSEYVFEEHIENVLLNTHGFISAQQADYDKALCLRPETVISFIRATQTKKWDDYCKLIGDLDQARRNVLKRIKEVVDNIEWVVRCGLAIQAPQDFVAKAINRSPIDLSMLFCGQN